MLASTSQKEVPIDEHMYDQHARPHINESTQARGRESTQTQNQDTREHICCTFKSSHERAIESTQKNASYERASRRADRTGHTFESRHK